MDPAQPTARQRELATRGEVITKCRLCGQGIAIPRWDAWNGFILQCPHCHGLHGKRWTSKSIVLASLFFNALSFFFTMRPRTAIPTLCAAALFTIGCNYVSDHFDLPLALDLVWSSIVILGPMIINAVVLVKHNSLLGESAHKRPSF
jgi:hypothetical protein